MNKKPFLAHIVIKYFDDEISTYRLSRIIEEFGYKESKEEIENYFGMVPYKVRKLLAKQEAKERIVELVKNCSENEKDKAYKEISGIIKGFGLNKSDLFWVKKQVLKDNCDVPEPLV